MSSTRRGGAVVLGELLITAGVLLLGFCAYVLWGTSAYTNEAQASLREELEESWARGEPAPIVALPSPTQAPLPDDNPVIIDEGPEEIPDEVPEANEEEDPSIVAGKPPRRSRTYIPGRAIGLIRIPELGTRWEKAVVEGVSRAALRRGPGHYPGTAEAGEVGNFVISGHRTTYGAPFRQIDELEAGDEIIFETRERIFVYKVMRQEIVSPRASGVLLPVPRDPEASKTPTRRLLTLTTCHPEYSARQRLIVYAELARSEPRRSGGG